MKNGLPSQAQTVRGYMLYDSHTHINHDTYTEEEGEVYKPFSPSPEKKKYIVRLEDDYS